MISKSYLFNLTNKLSSVRLVHTKCYQVLSGIQPTGNIHLGNYFGAIKQWVELQNYDFFSSSIKQNDHLTSSKQYLPPIYQIVDLHSLTTSHEPDRLRANILEVSAVLIACGVDPQKCILFKQSSVPYHGYLCWILSTISTLPQLYRFPQFKEKSAAYKEIPTGLFLYPILQTADILLYKGTHVPIGNDQLAHINLSKHLSAKFNSKFKTQIFPIPLELSPKDGAGKIKSLRAPEKKMSKSELDSKSRIELIDTDEDIIRKIRKSVTDIKSEITFDPTNRPGVSNLIQMYAIIENISINDVCNRFQGKDTFQFKVELGESLVEFIKPIRTKIIDLLNNCEYLENILMDGALKATNIAVQTIDQVNQAIGSDYATMKFKQRHFISKGNDL